MPRRAISVRSLLNMVDDELIARISASYDAQHRALAWLATRGLDEAAEVAAEVAAPTKEPQPQ